jgi:hypothetical protein
MAWWTLWLILSFFLFIFLHEVGHGVGAKLDGIHISTGFNRVGMPGRAPGDVNFRAGMSEGVWSGLLGPISTWVYAIVFTIWLYFFKRPRGAALLIGSFAVTNGFLRVLPMSSFYAAAIIGRMNMEDEVSWGIWQVTHLFRPDLAQATLPPTAWLSFPAVWLTPLASLLICLACLFFAYRKIFRLWQDTLTTRWQRLAFVLLPIVVSVAFTPVINWLDRIIRINW